MPIQFWAGATVPNRKAKPNPCTVSGRPPINTFAPLDYPATAKSLNQQIRASNKAFYKERGLNLGGGKSRVHGKRRLDRDNLIHRARASTEGKDRARAWMDRARVLSLRIDHAEGDLLDSLLKQYVECLNNLIQLEAKGQMHEIVRLETARGVVRASVHFHRVIS